jgi:hypothetical protein
MYEYFSHDVRRKMLHDWATNHKTIIVVNGGMSDVSMLPPDNTYNNLSETFTLEAAAELFKSPENTFPWASFYEPSINNALTCVGIILPEEIYNMDLLDETIDKDSYNFYLAKLIKSKPLAK